MRSFTRTVILGLVACLLAAPAAWADTGTILGTVRDADGQGLPGVTVVARNQASGITQNTVTDAAGNYRLTGLPIGMYTVTFTLTGFADSMREDIQLRLDDELVLNTSMQLEGVEETITVTSELPLVETTKAEFTTSVGGEQINNLPVNTRRWLDLALLTPGTSQDNIRGQFYNNVNIGGGVNYYANAFKVDGTNNTWAEMGEPRQNFPADAIAEFKVTPHQFKAEDGLATGGVLRVVTKSGTNQFHGSAFEFFRDESFNALGTFEQEKLPFRRHQFGGTLGGPIIENKTHFFGSFQRTERTDNFTVNTGGAWPGFEGTFPRTFERNMWTVRLDHQFSPSNRVFYRFARENEDAPNKVAGGSSADSLGFAVPRWSHVVGHTWVASDRIVNEFRFQAAYAMYQVYGSNGRVEYNPTSIDGLTEEQLRQHPGWESCAEQFNYPSLSVGSCSVQMGPEHRYQFRDDFSWFLSTSGGDTHDVKFGIDANYIPFEADTGGQSMKGSWSFPADRPYDPNDPETHPFLYFAARPAATSIPTYHISPYVQDDFSPNGEWTFNLGLRYDVQHKSFNEDILDEPRLDGIDIPWHTGDVQGFGNADDRGDLNNFGPRFGFAYSPGASGDLVVRGGAGIYYQNIRTLRNFGERLWPAQRSIVIVNPSFPDPFGGLAFDDFVAESIPNISLLANDMENPSARQYSLGVTKSVSANSALSVEGTYTETSGAQGSRDVNYFVEPGGPRPFPQFARATMLQSIVDQDYKALFVRFERRFRGDYQFLASYTLSEATGDFEGVPPDQTNLSNLNGHVSADRRHRFIVSGMAMVPGDVQLSSIVSWNSSLPFNASSGTDLNGDGRSGDWIPGVAYNDGCRGLDLAAVNAYRASRGLEPAGEPECPTYFNVDLRATKVWRLGDRFSLETIAQVFNLFNRDNFNSSVGNMLSGAFGIPVSASSKRQLELAARLTF